MVVDSYLGYPYGTIIRIVWACRLSYSVTHDQSDNMLSRRCPNMQVAFLHDRIYFTGR